MHHNTTSEQQAVNTGVWKQEAYVTVRDKAGSRARRKQISVPCFGSGNSSLNMSLVKMDLSRSQLPMVIRFPQKAQA